MCRTNDDDGASVLLLLQENKMKPPFRNIAKNGQKQPTSSKKNGVVRIRQRRLCNFRGMLMFSLFITIVVGIYNNVKLFCTNDSITNRCLLLENIGSYYYTSSSLLRSSLVTKVAIQQQQQQELPDPPVIVTSTTLIPTPIPLPPTNIPRTIFLFWESGFPATKLEVQMIYQSWKFFNPTYTIMALNGTEADILSNRKRFIPDEVFWNNNNKTTVQARSDIYRILLLYLHGGIWVDASLFCNYALDKWLDLNATELIAFRRTDNPNEQQRKNIDPWISSWFLASPPGSFILSKIIDIISNPQQYYRFQKSGGEYFWLHRIVAQIANSDETVMAHIMNYSSPIHCSNVGWKMQAPVLKRCANHYMYHMLATHQRCCNNTNNETTIMTTTGQWDAICTQWNCSMVSANLLLKDKITRLYGGSKHLTMLKSIWYKGMQLSPLPDPPITRVPASWKRKKVTKSVVKSTRTAAAVLGHGEIRPALVKDSAQSKIPRTIYILSESGWPSINARTNLIRKSFEIANPTFTIHALDISEAERLTNRSEHVPDSIWNTHITNHQYRSNIYRTILLYKYGGIWADFDVFCNRPLEEWLNLNSTDLVSFRRDDNLNEQTERGISPWISSWFLATPPGSYTISQLFNVISNSSELYHRTKQSFWWQRLVADLANSDEQIHDQIQSYPAASTCNGKLTAQTTVLKQCGVDRMAPILATTEQCCRPARGINKNARAGNDKARQKWFTKLCAKWNCTTQTANLRYNKVLKDWYGDGHQTLLQDLFSRNAMSTLEREQYRLRV